MKGFDNLTPEELDVLREVGNVGVGNASTALSQLLGKTIEISVPRVIIAKLNEIGEYIKPDEVIVGTVVGLNDLENNTPGYLYLVFPSETSNKIAEILVGDTSDKSMVESVVMEISNILASHFCDAIATMLNTVLIPTPPNYAEDYSIAVIDALIAKLAERSDSIIIFETELKDEQSVIDIILMLIPSESFLNYIVELLEMVG
ncbi:CheC, inhibitor of MCP methylation [Ferroglobus placidus DSM 10642]|uniref:CheC, inhibitor of MCP methylation n=1 Tax=Ferroglobus placidus (strain DSM 10642 / AEDII12DO) TaxID=589924 RepID=D3RXM0_FERPA|nr:chemotaxis protein CheC [Ferroglobus placidus]ADC65233.1 CheC, inhibitor of MCP methylation [Ferroglobus placidus DSM 10642]